MNLFNRLSKRSRAVVGLLILILAFYLLWSFVMADGNFVPKEFREANKQGALIASNIVSLSKNTADNLEQINVLDQNREYKKAMELVKMEVEKNNELQKQAYELSERLAEMGESLQDIKPRQATEVAVRALNYETSLIIRLLNYSGFLDELLLSLQAKFSGQYVPDGQVAELVAKINSESATINILNEEYKKAIEEFEMWVGK